MIPQEEHPDINFVGLLIGPHLTHDYHRIVTKRLKTTLMMRRCKLIMMNDVRTTREHVEEHGEGHWRKDHHQGQG